jgi:hypothetical protein
MPLMMMNFLVQATLNFNLFTKKAFDLVIAISR